MTDFDDIYYSIQKYLLFHSEINEGKKEFSFIFSFSQAFEYLQATSFIKVWAQVQHTFRYCSPGTGDLW